MGGDYRAMNWIQLFYMRS